MLVQQLLNIEFIWVRRIIEILAEIFEKTKKLKVRLLEAVTEYQKLS